MPRPTKCTPEVLARILDAIGQGAWAEQAARAAGIAPSTYYSWIERGEAGEEPFSEFSEALRAREAAAECTAVGIIRRAAEDGDWRAAAHYLERRYPERCGQRSKLEHSGLPTPGNPLLGGRDPIDVDPEIRRKIAALLLGEETP
jgi:hypothetical protein